MRCKYCGEEIKEDYLYCLSCGKPTEDSIKEYKIEEEKRRQKETMSIEYFEIQQEEEPVGKYDFSQFLENEEDKELDEIEFSTQEEQKEKLKKGMTDKHRAVEDDLQDTKERNFGRSDFKIYDEIRKNKNRTDYGFEENPPKTKKSKKNKTNKREEPRKEHNYPNREYGDRDFASQEEQRIETTRRKSRFWKRIRNFMYNILGAIGIWFLYLFLENVIPGLIYDITGIDILFTFDYRMYQMILIAAILFLFIPFFICKGNAKVPLFFFSILVSWTIIGWLILMIVAITSNLKFKRIY